MGDKRLGILVTLKDAASAGFLGLGGKIKLLNKEITEHNRKMQPLKNLYKSTSTALAPYTAAAKFLTGAMIGVGVASLALTKKAADVGQEFYLMSQRTGIAVETLSRWSYAAKMTGISIETIEKGFKKFGQNIAGLKEKTNQINVNFKQLGISTKDAAGNIRPMDDVLMDVADKFKEMPDGPRKAAIAIQLFGKSGAQMIPFLNKGRDGIKAMNDEADLFHVTIGSDAAAAANEFNQNLVRMKGFTGGLVNIFGQQMFPALNTLMEGFFSNKDAVKDLQIIAVKGAELIGTAFISLIPIMLDVGVAITTVSGGVIETLKGMASTARTIFKVESLIPGPLMAQGLALGALMDKADVIGKLDKAGTATADIKFKLGQLQEEATTVLAPALNELQNKSAQTIADIKSGKKINPAPGKTDSGKTFDENAEKEFESKRKAALAFIKDLNQKEVDEETKTAYKLKELHETTIGGKRLLSDTEYQNALLQNQKNFDDAKKAENLKAAQEIQQDMISNNQTEIQRLQAEKDAKIKILRDAGISTVETEKYYNKQLVEADKRAHQQREKLLEMSGRVMAGVSTKALQKLIAGRKIGAKQLLKMAQKEAGQSLMTHGQENATKGGVELAEAIFRATPVGGGDPSGIAPAGWHLAAGLAEYALGAKLAQGGGGGGAGGGGGGGSSGGGSGASRAGATEGALAGQHGKAVINIDMGSLANDDKVVTGIGPFTAKIVSEAIRQGNKGRVQINYV